MKEETSPKYPSKGKEPPQLVVHLVFSVQVYKHNFGLQLGKSYKHHVTLTPAY